MGRQGADLVVADPDTVVGDREVEHVVNEGFALGVALRRRKHMRQQLLHQLPVRLLIERLHFSHGQLLYAKACIV